MSDFRTYLFRYQHDGVSWAFDIQATSPEDAKARLAKIARASYDGELMASIPVPDVRSGWLGAVLRVLWPFR
jgi:hypothetical protein